MAACLRSVSREGVGIESVSQAETRREVVSISTLLLDQKQAVYQQNADTGKITLVSVHCNGEDELKRGEGFGSSQFGGESCGFVA